MVAQALTAETIQILNFTGHGTLTDPSYRRDQARRMLGKLQEYVDVVCMEIPLRSVYTTGVVSLIPTVFVGANVCNRCL
jgi:hypothetical protein